MTTNKIALSIDVEDWFHGPSITGSDFSFFSSIDEFFKHWDKTKNYDYLSKPLDQILRIFEEFQVKATFFIVADVIDIFPGKVESIVEKGHEIACHSLHHKICLNTKTKSPFISVSEFEDNTGFAKEKLEKVYGKKIIGYRAPGAYIGDWMLNSLIKLGFEYDSSISSNSIYNKTNFSTKGISSNPYWISKNDAQIFEIPWPYFNFLKLRLPTGGGPFFRLFPLWYNKLGIKSSLKRGDTMFYWHPYDLSSVPFPSLASKNSRRKFMFNKTIKNGEQKVKKLLQAFDGQWVTCEEIYRQNLS